MYGGQFGEFVFGYLDKIQVGAGTSVHSSNIPPASFKQHVLLYTC